jgi:hypothetical protein
MATHRGLDWGTQIIFNYGPLGFLAVPVTIYGGLTALAGAYTVAVLVGLAWTFLWATWRGGLPLALAVATAFVACSLTTLDAVVPIVFICCALALREDPSPRWRAAIVYGGGTLCALESLVKLSSGLAVLAMVAITVLALPGRRGANLGRFAATFVATVTVLWFAAGQGFANVDDYLTTSASVVSGYSAGVMATGSAATARVGLALVAAALVACWIRTREVPRGRRTGSLALVAILSLIAWKEGFVRQDFGHLHIFFAWMLAPWIALVVAPRGRWLWLGMAGFTATVVAFFLANNARPADYFDPIESARTAVTQVHDLLDPAARGRNREAARQLDRSLYRVDRRTLEEIGGRSVDVYPWNASLAWALELNWHPVPAFQSFTAYAPTLDDRNADALASASGPRLVLRHQTGPTRPGQRTVFGIDARYAPYDTPAATLALLCHFHALRTTPRYQLLARTANRCGDPRPLRSVDAGYGETVAIPRPSRRDEVVLAEVSGLAPSGLERLRTFLFRAAIRYVVFAGGATYRLVPANAGDGLILTAPRRLDFPPPWRLAPNTSTITFAKEPGFASPANSLRIDFYAMPIRRG